MSLVQVLARRSERSVQVAFCALWLAFAVSPALADEPKVLIETSSGNFTVALEPDRAPITVRNFLRYVAEHHFDGTAIYRIVPGFVIEAGSYDADGNYRSVHAPIALEANNGLTNLRGTLAMARVDEPNSATAEFFINLADNPNLDRDAKDSKNATGYAVFGRVVSGMDVVDRIAAVPLGGKGPFPGAAPLTPVTILRVSPVP
jgi:peptidyl-prolyl cis-trans isomerase A (cyclophilin A)